MKFRIRKLKKVLEKVIFFIVKYDFLACLFLFFLSLAFGALLIYKYSVLAQKIEPGEIDQSFLIKEKKYQEVLKIWQEHGQISEQADFKEYPDPFNEELTE